MSDQLSRTKTSQLPAPTPTHLALAKSVSNPDAGRLDRSDVSSPTAAQKRKRNAGGFARIDAWWSAVRNSFGTQADSTRSTETSPKKSGSSASWTQGTLRQRVSREEMPPPPVPLRAASGSHAIADPGPLAAASTFSGALAPAATIDTQPRRPSSSSGQSRLRPSVRTSASASASTETDAFDRGDQRRRHPHLSLRLDPSANPFASSTVTSNTSGVPRKTSRPLLPTSLSQDVITTEPEATPALTPGRSPAWAQTPSIVPTSLSTAEGAPKAPSVDSGRSSGPQPAPSFSIASIQQHIRHRLTFAKETCDKELRKISSGITAHVEQELRLSRTLSHEEGSGSSAPTPYPRTAGDHSPWSASASALTSDAEGPDSDATGDERIKVRFSCLFCASASR